MAENKFQAGVIKEIKARLPFVIILKNDAGYRQGFSDLSILYEDKWALLECKDYATAPHQPNQDTYVSIGSEWSFARFIYPENKEEVLNELYAFFGV